MLQGPYPLSQAGDVYVKSGPGVYALSRDRERITFMGRSDTDLHLRIRQSPEQADGYRYFWFEDAESPKDAYLKECAYFHEYRPPDNLNHPAVPAGTDWKCPVKGCDQA
jgi:hypothetical protein